MLAGGVARASVVVAPVVLVMGMLFVLLGVVLDGGVASAAEPPDIQVTDLRATPDEAPRADGPLVVRRRRRRRHAVSREMKQLGRAHGEEFFGLAGGAAVGILAASALSMLWRRSPLAARLGAGGGLAAATTFVLGLWLVAGRVGPAIAGSGVCWLVLTATLVLVFRTPAAVSRKVSLAWLRVPSSRGPARRRGRQGKGAAIAGSVVKLKWEADALLDDALAALDAGDVEGSVSGLRRSIEVRPTKRAHTFLGTVLGARGQKEEALAELDGALALDPAYGEALDEKARILDELGRREEAAAVRERRGSSASPGPGRARREEAKAVKAASLPAAARLPDLSRPRKRAVRLTRAGGPGTLAPWTPAAAFSGAVVAGALLSLVYAAGREHMAARGVIGVLDDAEAGLSASAGEAVPSVGELERRRLEVLAGNPFTRDRAASLKTALALHAYGRAKELEEIGKLEKPDKPKELDKLDGEHAKLSRWAAGWARRRIAEARAALSAGDRTRLPMGLAEALAAQRGDFEREIECRRRRMSAPVDRQATGTGESVSPGPPPGRHPARDWRSIWKRPAPGTTFTIEVFRRVGLTASGVRAAVGKHADGSQLEAVGLLRCTVAPPPSGRFVFLVESLPFSVGPARAPAVRQAHDGRDLSPSKGAPAHGIPPAVRLVPKEGKKVAGPFRVEFGPRLEFRSVASLANGREEVIVSRSGLYAAREIPFKSLPIFAPGLGPGWQQHESYMWPYPEGRDRQMSGRRGEGAVQGAGPALKQVTHWKMIDGVTRMRVGWRMRYMLKAKEYTEQVVQAWTPSRPWWDFYDDGVLFFRTVFLSEEDASVEEGRR